MVRHAVPTLATLLITACAGTRAPDHRPDTGASDVPHVGWPDTGWTPAYDATTEQAPLACGPTSCAGCCQSAGGCVQGSSDTECGQGGAPCVDCTAQGASCTSGACLGCSPACAGKVCGAADGCGGTCQSGSGCCSPSCAGKACGADDGCGGTCQLGSGCCTPACGGKQCGADDGCGGGCAYGSGCTPSCGALLAAKGLPDAGGGCCGFGCDTTEAGGPGATWDCTYCCSSTAGSGACSLPSCGALLASKGLPNAGLGCCVNGCATTAAGGPGSTYDCPYCCSSTPGQQPCQ